MKFETKLFTTLISAFVIVAAVNFGFIYVSVTSYDGLVEDNYYNRALNYQEEKIELERQQTLGWNFSTKTVKQKDQLFYTLEVKDKSGKAIDKAHAEVTFFRPTQSGFDQSLTLNETKAGTYQGSVNLPLKGVWDVHINFKKNAEKWKKKERLTVSQ